MARRLCLVFAVACITRLYGGLELQITVQRWKNWLDSWHIQQQIWPKFKLALAKHEWVIYPFFTLLVVIFLLLLPRGCNYP
jgi:hypothetical protein